MDSKYNKNNSRFIFTLITYRNTTRPKNNINKMETETTTQQNRDHPKIIPRKLFKNNKTHDITHINTEQISLLLQDHYKLVSTDELILKEKDLLWELRCKIQKKGSEMVKNKMLDFVKSINGITYTGQKVISYPQIKKWYINPETSDTNMQIIFFMIFLSIKK